MGYQRRVHGECPEIVLQCHTQNQLLLFSTNATIGVKRDLC